MARWSTHRKHHTQHGFQSGNLTTRSDHSDCSLHSSTTRISRFQWRRIFIAPPRIEKVLINPLFRPMHRAKRRLPALESQPHLARLVFQILVGRLADGEASGIGGEPLNFIGRRRDRLRDLGANFLRHQAKPIHLPLATRFNRALDVSILRTCSAASSTTLLTNESAAASIASVAHSAWTQKNAGRDQHSLGSPRGAPA